MINRNDLEKTLTAPEKKIYNQISNTTPNESRCRGILSNMFLNFSRGNLTGLDVQLMAVGACNDFRLNYTAAKLCYMIQDFSE